MFSFSQECVDVNRDSAFFSLSLPFSTTAGAKIKTDGENDNLSHEAQQTPTEVTNWFYWLWVTCQRFLSHLSHQVSVQEFMCKHRLCPLLQQISNLFVHSCALWQGGKDGAALKQETGTEVLACHTPAVSSRHPDGDSSESERFAENRGNSKFHARDSAVSLEIRGCSLFHARCFETPSVWSRANRSGRKSLTGKHNGSSQVSE